MSKKVCVDMSNQQTEKKSTFRCEKQSVNMKSAVVNDSINGGAHGFNLKYVRIFRTALMSFFGAVCGVLNLNWKIGFSLFTLCALIVIPVLLYITILFKSKHHVAEAYFTSHSAIFSAGLGTSLIVCPFLAVLSRL